MEVWKSYLEVGFVVSWFIFVASAVILTYIVIRVTAMSIDGNHKLQSTQDAIIRLEQFLPSLREREIELTETIKKIKAQAQALSQFMEHIQQAESEKRDGGND